MKVKIIKRRYFSKKLGIFVEKEYKYSGTSRKGLTIVYKGGKINKKNYEAVKEAIRNNPNYSEQQKRTALADFESLIKERHQNKKRLTTTGLEGRRQKNDIDRLLANAGYTSKEAAQELGISEKEILNPKNWMNGQFTSGGKKWNISWSYTSSIFKEVV